MGGNSPTGEWIEDPATYAESWASEARFFAEWMGEGYAPHSYDPTFSFRRDRGGVTELPTEVVLRVNALLRRQEGQKKMVEESLEALVPRERKCPECGHAGGGHLIDPGEGPCEIGEYLDALAELFDLPFPVQWHDEDGPVSLSAEEE